MACKCRCHIVGQVVKILVNRDLSLPSAQHSGSDNGAEGDEFCDRHVMTADDDFFAGRFDRRNEL